MMFKKATATLSLKDLPFLQREEADLLMSRQPQSDGFQRMLALIGLCLTICFKS